MPMQKFTLTILFLLLITNSNSQIITTIAGTGSTAYTGDGTYALTAAIGEPQGCSFDAYGNFYFADVAHCVIRKITPCGIISTVAGTGVCGYNGDSILATSAKLHAPGGLAFDTSGNLYIAEQLNNRIRKVTVSTGLISTIAGNGTAGFSGDGGLAVTAVVYNPASVCFDRSGNIFIVDAGNERIRKISNSGIISTYAGTGVAGYSGDGGLATLAKIENVSYVCTDTSGNIYFQQQGLDAVIRKIDTSGIISTIAGNGSAGPTGDGGLAIDAGLNPLGLVFDNAGNLFVSGYIDNDVRKINDSGIIYSVAGNGTSGFTGDGGIATSAELYEPFGIAVDIYNNLYISDFDNHRIRKVTFNAIIPPAITIATSSSDTICNSTSATYTATVAGAITTFSYQWIVNGSAIAGATSNTYTYFPGNGDSINCVLSVNGLCAMPVSNIIYMTVTGITPAISISAGTTDTTCAGASLSYTATVTGTDSAVYVWYVNGVSISATTDSIYTYTPANGDHITCKVSGTNMCSSIADTLTSNTITMLVNPVITPSVSITSSITDTICVGTSVTFTATSSGGGSAPLYQWIRNSIPVATGISYTYLPANGDSVRCLLTSSSACTMPATAGSNTITMLVNPVITPSVSITSSTSDTICAGTLVIFTATSSGGGTAPLYQWVRNGSVADTSTSYTYTPSNGDSVRCLLTGSSSCTMPAATSSNTIVMIVDTLSIPAISVTGPSPVAVGSTFTLTATVTNAGSSYSIDWYNNGTLFATTTTPTVTVTAVSDLYAITAQLIQQSFHCNDSATSDTVFIVATDGVGNITAFRFSVYPDPAHSLITITGPGISTVIITNTIGQLQLTKSDVKDTVNIDISALPPGIYLITVIDTNGSRTINKFVKQ